MNQFDKDIKKLIANSKAKEKRTIEEAIKEIEEYHFPSETNKSTNKPPVKGYQKRDCPIKMHLDIDRYYEILEMDIGSDHHLMYISSIVGSTFEDLIVYLYYFYPGVTESYDPESEFADLIELWLQNDDFSFPECSLHSIPKEEYVCGGNWKFEINWDGEGPLTNIMIEREPTERTEFDIKINLIAYKGDKEKHYTYVVSYQDFIYAVCKAYTEMVRKYGLFGFHRSFPYGDIILRQFLYLKAIALNNFDPIKDTVDPQNDWRYYSNFDEELELMKFEM